MPILAPLKRTSAAIQKKRNNSWLVFAAALPGNRRNCLCGVLRHTHKIRNASYSKRQSTKRQDRPLSYRIGRGGGMSARRDRGLRSIGYGPIGHLPWNMAVSPSRFCFPLVTLYPGNWKLQLDGGMPQEKVVQGSGFS